MLQIVSESHLIAFEGQRYFVDIPVDHIFLHVDYIILKCNIVINGLKIEPPHVQWNLRIADALGTLMMFLIRRLNLKWGCT